MKEPEPFDLQKELDMLSLDELRAGIERANTLLAEGGRLPGGPPLPPVDTSIIPVERMEAIGRSITHVELASFGRNIRSFSGDRKEGQLSYKQPRPDDNESDPDSELIRMPEIHFPALSVRAGILQYHGMEESQYENMAAGPWGGKYTGVMPPQIMYCIGGEKNGQFIIQGAGEIYQSDGARPNPNLSTFKLVFGAEAEFNDFQRWFEGSPTEALNSVLSTFIGDKTDLKEWLPQVAPFIDGLKIESVQIKTVEAEEERPTPEQVYQKIVEACRRGEVPPPTLLNEFGDALGLEGEENHRALLEGGRANVRLWNQIPAYNFLHDILTGISPHHENAEMAETLIRNLSEELRKTITRFNPTDFDSQLAKEAGYTMEEDTESKRLYAEFSHSQIEFMALRDRIQAGEDIPIDQFRGAYVNWVRSSVRADIFIREHELVRLADFWMRRSREVGLTMDDGKLRPYQPFDFIWHGNPVAIGDFLAESPPAEIAQVMGGIPSEERGILFKRFDPILASDVTSALIGSPPLNPDEAKQLDEKLWEQYTKSTRTPEPTPPADNSMATAEIFDPEINLADQVNDLLVKTTATSLTVQVTPQVLGEYIRALPIPLGTIQNILIETGQTEEVLFLSARMVTPEGESIPVLVDLKSIPGEGLKITEGSLSLIGLDSNPAHADAQEQVKEFLLNINEHVINQMDKETKDKNPNWNARGLSVVKDRLLLNFTQAATPEPTPSPVSVVEISPEEVAVEAEETDIVTQLAAKLGKSAEEVYYLLHPKKEDDETRT